MEIADELGKTASQVALRWVLDQPGVSSVILGVRRVSQLKENIGCLAVRLSPDMVEKLDAVSAVDLGFPHEFINRETIIDLVTGGVNVQK